MLRARLITILCVVIAVAPARSDDSKIVGGRFVDDVSSMPFIVSIQVKNIGHNCGGSLLTQYYVLSACHCLSSVGEGESPEEPIVMYDPEKFLFVAGVADFNRDMGQAQVREARSFHVHPKCSKDMMIIYDFSVGEMKESFQITERVRPFRLLTAQADEFDRKFFKLLAKDDTVCKVAGWGETRRGAELADPTASTKLKTVRMFIITDKKCQELYGEREKSFANFPFQKYSQICAVSRFKNESDCLGDSGSPFFCGDYVIGVVSYGFECGTEMPSVYTGLAMFLEWFMSEVYPLRPDHLDLRDNILSHRKTNGSIVLPLSTENTPRSDANKIHARTAMYGWLCLSILCVLQAVYGDSYDCSFIEK